MEEEYTDSYNLTDYSYLVMEEEDDTKDTRITTLFLYESYPISLSSILLDP